MEFEQHPASRMRFALADRPTGRLPFVKWSPLKEVARLKHPAPKWREGIKDSAYACKITRMTCV